MTWNTLWILVLVWMSLHICACRNLHFSTSETPKDGEAGFATSPLEQQLEFADDPQPDGSISSPLLGSTSRRLPDRQALSHRSLHIERSHQEIYESLWKNANVPMDTSSASKIDVLGYLLKKQVKKLRDVSNGQVELVFLVDSSASVGIDNFFNELKFVKKLLADFTVAPDATRVAIITFSSKHRVDLNVNQLDDSNPQKRHHKCALLNEDLPKITYVGGGTYTKGAFENAKKVLEAARPNSTKSVFLLTDGLSNGPNPVPVAELLKDDGVEVFTFGIRDGYIPELLQMASERKDEHCYILDSFAEFEALARRALHEDLRVGEFIEELPEKCASRCLGGAYCCDPAATCRCGTHTGSYDCVCPAGFYGSGLRGSCRPCPVGTYKWQALPGGISTCVPCPDVNHVSPTNSTSPFMCVCKEGYRWDIATSRCQVIHCPVLTRPENGEFVECSNVFHGACAVRCHRGYELTGSSIRLCFSNGSWSGEDFRCRVKKCEEFTAPMNGSMQCTSDNFAFGTVCTASCDPGFKLVGSPSRRCLPIAQWDGLPVTCRPIQCPMLSAIPFGSLLPSRCSRTRQDYGSVCRMRCNPGFQRRGPRKKECLANGSWSNQYDPSAVCEDFTVPNLVCPPPITAETTPRRDSTLVTWTVPTPTDNSGEVPTLRAIPNVESPWEFPLGHWNVTYIAEDASQNRAQCVFSVIVEDREPPSISRCRSPGTVITSRQEHRVTWDEPLFSDNSGSSLTVTRSHEPGSLFPLGRTSVEYLATDEAGNTRSCVIFVDVQQNLCQKPRDPVGGSAVCLHTTQGMNCTVTCGPGYALSTRPRGQYFCAPDGTWHPDGKVPWDDCSETHHANNVLQPMTFLYETSDCDTPFARRVEKILSSSLDEPIRNYCGDGVMCRLSSVEARCRSNDPITLLHGLPTSYHGDLQPGAPQALQGRGDISVDPQRLRLLATPNLFVNVIINASVIPNDTTQDQGLSAQFYDKVVAETSQISNRIETNLNNGSIESGANRSTEGEEGGGVRVWRIRVIRKEPEAECSPGSVRQGRGRDAQCVPCIHGTYFNESMSSCEYCPRGTFQDRVGQTECQPCPLGTSTLTNKATALDECRELCQPGSHSLSGLELCELCPNNTYQSDWGGTDCISCPRGLRTAAPGAADPSQCRAPCPSGHTSATGLEPCLPCPAGTFKMSNRFTYCLRCPASFPFSSPGISSIRGCRNAQNAMGNYHMAAIKPVPFSECFSSPCQNGATCNSASRGYTCQCPQGFSGLRCDVEVDECETAMCLNNGTCQDLLNGYECHCPEGFTGRHCSEDIDECDSYPCTNGGTCINGPNQFECICPEQYTGDRCEADKDECMSAPCHNDGSCRDLMGGFVCICPPGFYGNVCEMDYDECSSYPCQNNATCFDLENDFSCHCKEGFAGDKCELNVDDCVSNPCVNGATCTDLVADVRCRCLPGFRGHLCEEEMSWDFNLIFDRAGVEDYVILERDFPTLRAVTIAFWMRTDDTANYGTVFSYAISDSNANVLTLTDYSGFVLDVNGHLKVTDVTTNDGYWHHVAITWESSGSYQVFKDGELQASGQELARGAILPGGGKFIIGQEQDSLGGGFHPRESFVGEIYLLTVSDRVLSADEVQVLSRSCERLADVVVAWPDFLSGVQGDIQRVENHFCEGCTAPARPENGLIHDYQAATPLSSVRYDCQPGFQLPRYEINSAECQISGEWSPSEQPYCERISCGHPGPVNHGRVVGRTYLFGDQVLHACHSNFTLVGPLSRQCQANGQWSEYAPECRYVVCLAPPAMPNSLAYSVDTMRSVEMAFPGHMAVYQCNRGFRLTGPANVTCQTDGQWSESPSCQVISCPPLVPSPNPMLVTSNGSVYSSIAEYRCIEGYRMQGQAIIQCRETGLWDNQVPTCSIVICGHPRSIPNADVTYDGISYRSTAWYTCREGYESDWRASYCSARGSWEPPSPICRPVQCPAISSLIPHTTIHGMDFTFNSTIAFECDRGYVLSGEKQIRCTGNGRWSGDPPICNPVPCADPPVFDNYAANATAPMGTFTFGAVVQYDCHSGFYRPTPGSQLVCAEDGRWVGSLSECLPVSCGPPSHIPHASYQGQDHTYDQTVTYDCDTGYELTGNPSITCLASGQWSQTTALCSLIYCSDPPVISNGDVSPERNFNETARYTCRHGYVSEDSMEVYCDATGTWQGLPPTCSPVFCGPPPSQENGFAIGDTWTFLSSVELSCNRGYELLGDPRIHCLGSGQWSNSSSRCIPLTCQPPVTIGNGVIIGHQFTYGSHIEYQCHDGYILEGQSTLQCTENALWSGPPPRCRAVNCGPPADMADGLYIGYDFTFNQTVLYICQPGFEFGGEADYVEATCLADGTWSQLTAICQAVNCGEPAPPAHGSVAGVMYTYSSIITYSCDPGYTVTGLSSQTCTSNGTWSGPAPSCEPRDCGAPPTIPNGIGSYVATTFESTANYSCLTGYQSPAPLTLQCDAAGMWAGEADNTSCQRIQCKEEIMVIHNGFAEESGPYVYGDTVQISCEEGFKSDATQEMRCTALGTWMPQNISCIPITCPPVLAPENGIIMSGSQRWGEELTIGCLEGHQLVGTTTILCSGDGVWIGDVPECVVITCKALQALENGVVHMEDHSYGSRAEFECNRGFQMVGSNITECTGHGTWSSPPPTCNPISCPYPANPSHGVAIFVDTYYRDVVSYICEPGYRLVGTETRQCQADGSWNGAPPSCTPVECEVIEAFPLGIVIRNDTVILGDEVIYSCNLGYEVVGQTSRVCTQDGTLSGQTPTCVRVICGPPPPLLNGHASYTSDSFESNATYTCDHGYILEGSARTFCLANGSWELIYRNCRPVECSHPMVILNGVATMNFTRPIFGTIAEYACEYGYELRGQGIQRCQANGEWSDREPHCEPVSCGQPPALLNGFQNFSTTTFGSQSMYSCHTGYVLVGNRVRVCQATALWSEVVQSCEPISCGMPVTPPYSMVMTFNTSLNGVATYRCDDGYRLVGAHTRRCTHGGVWSGAVPECVLVSCPPPTSIENGDIVTFGRMQFMDHIHYRCHRGHKIHGDVRRVCQVDGTWSGRRPSCRPISCEVPPIIKNGIRTYTLPTFNNTATFDCHSGYVLRGAPVLRCMADGTWYPPAPACQPIKCGPLPHPQNGRVVMESKVYRSTAIYHCHEGFVINGSKRRGCLASGVWSESPPTCQAKLCQPLPVIEYALYPANKTKFVVGDFVELECKAGYQATSDGIVRCLANQTWSVKEFSCIPSSCSEPVPPENGRAKYTSLSFGSTVTFLCNHGFRAGGETVATCQENLNWSSPPPQCLPATCQELVAPENVILSSTSISVGTTVLLSCSGHSKLVGASRVVCLANGTWSHSLPRCIPNGCGPPPSLDNGVSHGDSFLPGDVVSFRCHRGFYRDGSSSTTCLPDNTWSHPNPVCIRFDSIAAVQNRPICVVPCLHGGKCVGPYSCECPYGFAGPRCGTVLCASRCIGAARCAARDARCRR